ncbi:23S rRNA (uracil(1939)-C(5))-methyltransferase RlmD [Arenimonas sp. MALMAid1274]|uniref:23S rRNA (uracil(1939)-C(5))-methyltransferase RlmD n=1 Tax=Arenimonas sp. MALMAid1274 TaxID=3411630 RepID=UPI003BA00723
MARSRSKIHQVFELAIDGMTHDGRGVGRREGKAVFVSGALPGETVRVEQTGRNRSFDEGRTLEVLQASPQRVEPRCPHFGTCAGCVLQHLEAPGQIAAKHGVLQDSLQRLGHVTPERVLEPLVDAAWGYRRKGRFSVRYVEKKGKVVVGFRESNPRFVADLTQCHTVVPEIGQRIPALADLVDSLDGRRTLPQIEFIAGDEGVALVFRHLEPLSAADVERLRAFACDTGFAVFLQPGGLDTVHALWPEQMPLSFSLGGLGLSLAFRPLDFIQVNAGLNDKMIARALELLDPQPQDRVLDLFCGLGNFTLPLAQRAGQVVGVEGDAGLVERARANAIRNGLGNVAFHAADLPKDLSGEPWMRDGFDKLLLDPPRAGAAEVLAQLPLEGIRRIVYVSCHPGSLARDAGFLVRERGYALKAAGAMDMFPQTAHVESIALFEK